MSKETKELREMDDDKLIKEKKSLLINLLSASPNVTKPIIPHRKRGLIRRRIARINTIMGERGRRGVLKEEKRLK